MDKLKIVKQGNSYQISLPSDISEGLQMNEVIQVGIGGNDPFLFKLNHPKTWQNKDGTIKKNFSITIPIDYFIAHKLDSEEEYEVKIYKY